MKPKYSLEQRANWAEAAVRTLEAALVLARMAAMPKTVEKIHSAIKSAKGGLNHREHAVRREQAGRPMASRRKS